MTRSEAEDFNRRMLAAGCHGSQCYALKLEKRVEVLERALRLIAGEESGLWGRVAHEALRDRGTATSAARQQ